MIKVYIASPYTKGDVAKNVSRQIRKADMLIHDGFAPFVPLLSHFQHMQRPREYEEWMKLDMEWLKVCDCLLRLDGESAGADREVEWANNNNMLVFFNYKDLLSFYGKR